MSPEIYEWLQLLTRWVHITVGVTWIGTSIFFMWLDRTFEKDPSSAKPGHLGTLWMVHGGGFYHVEKLQMGPTKVPEHLHWFKWESYWTWMSGAILLWLMFYSSGGTLLIDSTISEITFTQGILIGVGTLVVSWFFYDLLWENRLTRNRPVIGHTLTLLWFAGVTYFLCHTFSGRAAYMHVGAMLGTWMTGNVFLRIIPRQVKMVEATKSGQSVNPDWAANAKNRSTHNTYFTLPVILIMLSNHFPATYASNYPWLVLLGLSAGSAAIRHFFILRIKNPRTAKLFGAAGLFLIFLTIFLAKESA